MLFLKKKEVESKTVDFYKAARGDRYTTLARVAINGFEGQGLLRNVSSGGFCMESKTFAGLDVGSSYTIQIIPEASAGINRIDDLTVEVRWARTSPEKFAVGFQVLQSSRSFEKYVEYIRAHRQLQNRQASEEDIKAKREY
ncbi:MAG: hypothetical protein LBT16_11920 [Treponema sp.]|jgi:hypothetical protein|nr:hypothetical protein [Treponema sp.]